MQADSCKEVRKTSGGQFGLRKTKDGVSWVEPFDKQQKVLELHQYYAKLKRDESYQRRISYINDASVFVVEFLGIFPITTKPHGNSTKSSSEYVRTHPKTLIQIQERCRNSKMKPRGVYQEFNLDACKDDNDKPRNRKQVENVARRMVEVSGTSTNNIADEMITLCSRLTEDDFVQVVHFAKGHTPCVFMYTDQQIGDLRIACGKDTPPELRSVLAIDRTFNFSSLYVTLTVYKQKKVTRKSSSEAPVFIGPMMLHGDGKFATYLSFFSHLCGALNRDMSTSEFRIQDSVITGSDEEIVFVRAVETAFPSSRHLYCTIHCKDNVRHHLTSIGVATKIRENILCCLFGADSLEMAGDEEAFDNRVAELMQYLRQQNIDAVDYIQNRIIPKIANNCRMKWAESWIGQQQWTNNNCESANHVLKMAVDWKPKRLTDLVDHLRDLVRLQFSDLKRSLCGLGEFQLTPAFGKHVVSQVIISFIFL